MISLIIALLALTSATPATVEPPLICTGCGAPVSITVGGLCESCADDLAWAGVSDADPVDIDGWDDAEVEAERWEEDVTNGWYGIHETDWA